VTGWVEYRLSLDWKVARPIHVFPPSDTALRFSIQQIEKQLAIWNKSCYKKPVNIDQSIVARSYRTCRLAQPGIPMIH